MTQARALRLIIGSMALTAVVATIREVVDGRLATPKVVVGSIVAAIVLSAMTEFAPRPAAAIAVIVLIGVVLGTAPDTFRKLSGGIETLDDRQRLLDRLRERPERDPAAPKRTFPPLPGSSN